MNEMGFLTWWTVPEVSAPYAALTQLASRVGLPNDCVPKPPSARHAWEKASNVGGQRGLKLEPPVALADQIFMQYGAPPAIRLLTRRVSDSAPVLRRHLVREASIPTSGDHWKQLSLQTVAVLEFDCQQQRADSSYLYDQEGWTNGNVQTVVAQIEDKYRHLLHHADGNDVREGVRKLLEQLHRVGLRGTGGVYFVPCQAGAEPQLQALRTFIRSLSIWQVGKLRPACNIVRLSGEEAENLKEEIIESATDEFKRRLADLSDKIDPLLQGAVSGRLADRIAEGATNDLLLIQAAVRAYQHSLHDELTQIGDMLNMAEAAVSRALGVVV
ncbi:hypothetical protein TFLX_06086 [Thermoflexales bacterium]|nr:hypothetical protein TFLX_06086 [Thermoflexales bacterium]